MHSSACGTDILREWGQLQRRSKRDPGVAYGGYRTGQLALHFGSRDDGIRRVFLKAVSAPGVGEEPMVFYHPVVHWQTEDGRRGQHRSQFRHPMPAHDWLLETVPDFDLVETVYLNVTDEDATEDSGPVGVDG